MAEGASTEDLKRLQGLVVQQLADTLERDAADNIPTDAATLGVIVKLLKDNAITSDPADADDLNELRDKLAQQAAQRRQNRGNIVALAQSDLKLMEG